MTPDEAKQAAKMLREVAGTLVIENSSQAKSAGSLLILAASLESSPPDHAARIAELEAEMRTMKNSVVEACVRLPNVGEYIEHVEHELDRLRPVVDAAKAWSERWKLDQGKVKVWWWQDSEIALAKAIDAGMKWGKP